jgi:hypothetical protein
MRNSIKRAITTVALGVALVSAISAKDANAFLDLNLISATPVGTNTAFTYEVSLVAGFNINENSSLTMFDFLGFQSVSGFTGLNGFSNSLFTITAPATGPTTPLVGADTATPNIFLDSTGSVTTSGSNIILGRFTAVSSFGNVGSPVNPFRADTINQTGNTTAVAGSFVQGPGQVAVPEAGTMALLATGLLGMVGVGLRRRTAK